MTIEGTADKGTLHEHRYQPNGLVREQAVSYSPVSALDHVYYEKVYSVGLCECGAVSKKHVANENQRTGLELARSR